MQKVRFIVIFLMVLNANATDPCTDPFSGERMGFTLTEPLSCDPTQSTYQLDINPETYLKPSCIGNLKVLDLYLDNGQKIRSFSDEQTGQPGWGSLTVSSACDGRNLFTIMPDYQIPGIGSVNPEENTVNGVILRNNKTEIIASASKSLISEASCGKAVWNVTNNAALSPQVMAYLLALKDNRLFSCNAPPVGQASSGLSSGAVVGIVAAIVIPTTIGSFFLYRWIHRNYPGVFKRKTYDPVSENLS